MGTTIGGGILALPLSLATGGFVSAAIWLIITWLLMTAGAFLILEVNLHLPDNTNIISMANLSLGKKGKAVAWLCYLGLVYCLLAAYISAASDVIASLLQHINVVLPHQLVSVIVTIIIATIVFHGICAVDWVNRFIMTIKFIALFLLIFTLLFHIHWEQLLTLHFFAIVPMVTVLITSFGYGIIVPSLRTYFNSDVRKLRRVILIGSTIPLIIYLLWVAVVMGVLPMQGKHSLLTIANDSKSVSSLMNALKFTMQTTWFNYTISIFITICVFTSFLGVSLCLFDFFADGLKIDKTGHTGLLVTCLTFIPPMLSAILAPNIFVAGLNFSGIFCTVLLILLPALMAWRTRYHLDASLTNNKSYQVMGHKPLLATIIISASIVIVLSIWYNVISQFFIAH